MTRKKTTKKVSKKEPIKQEKNPLEDVSESEEELEEELEELSEKERNNIINASKALYNLPSTKEVLEDLEKEPPLPTSIQNPLYEQEKQSPSPVQPPFNDFAELPVEGNNAMRMHYETKEIRGTIAENTCLRNGSACIYAPHLSKYKKNQELTEEQCEFKNYLDNQIFEMLKSGLILTIQISHCDHYVAENDMGKIAERIIV